MSRSSERALAFALALLAGCGAPPAPATPAAASSAAPATSASALAPADPLGPRPVPGEMPAFDPPAPVVLDGPGGSKVWLVERHALPLVSIALVVPFGASRDPEGEAGLATITADMLDEGAGARDALAFSSALQTLGATLSASADRDASSVRLDVLASKLPEALALFADAVLRPRHDAKDWKRVSTLWQNRLRAREDEPTEVARVVTAAAAWDAADPYSRPTDGTLASAKRVALADVRAFHRAAFRPAHATFVVVGDVDAAKATALLAKAFSGFVDGSTPAAPPLAPVKRATHAGLRTLVVDRKDAPQVVLSIARPSVPASDDSLAPLEMTNIALGGSFTSRLVQNLREDHGYTYGVRSRFAVQARDGLFVVRSSIRTDAIGAALGEALRELTEFAAKGPTVDEIEKVRAQATSDVVSTYGSLHGIAASLATNAGLGLGPDADRRALAAQRAALPPLLRDLAKTHFDLEGATIVMVGPVAAAREAARANGLPEPELVDAEGRPVAAR